jgi:hypothetical protein
MFHRVILIGKWVVDFVFATERYDVDGILSCLYDAGAPRWAMDDAEELMSSGDFNTGFTYANPGNRRAVVVIGPTTSGAEFTNTLTHEIHHLAVAIASELGIDLESETPAYLAGDSARALAEVVCELGCEHCRG